MNDNGSLSKLLRENHIAQMVETWI